MTFDLSPDSTYSLDELVAEAERLLPRVVPEGVGGKPFNPRLVRYYQSEGFLDRPERRGREARYGRRQLLQLLAVRRLLAEGWRGAAIAKVTQRSDEVLEAMLRGGVEVTVEAANPALAFLAQIRKRDEAGADEPPAAPMARPRSGRPPVGSDHTVGRAHSASSAIASLMDEAPLVRPSASAVSEPERAAAAMAQEWTRLRLQDDVELSVRSDFRRPRTPEERRTLRRAIEAAIDQLLDEPEEE